jgi:hypothetical protein
MAFTPPIDELDDLFEGQAAYIMNYGNGFDDDEESDLMNPFTSTEAKPGSDDKVQMLAARYAAGLPLWHNSDCYDHGPDAQDSEDEEDEMEFLEELETVK